MNCPFPDEFVHSITSVNFPDIIAISEWYALSVRERERETKTGNHIN